MAKEDKREGRRRQGTVYYKFLDILITSYLCNKVVTCVLRVLEGGRGGESNKTDRCQVSAVSSPSNSHLA